ncbi:MAG: hypothetical protein PXY39_06835 [archaeon]|nr:hypothetical protein [archaeon]
MEVELVEVEVKLVVVEEEDEEKEEELLTLVIEEELLDVVPTVAPLGVLRNVSAVKLPANIITTITTIAIKVPTDAKRF